MPTVFGLTPAGFVLKPQSQIVSEIQAQLQAVFGQNINLGPESNFGQLTGIFSEREALIWKLAQAVYASQYPAGAEGTSVDNILAYNNLKRLPASPTKTAQIPVTQSNGITLYPLALFGTPGTVIPQGSLVETSASPPLQFSTDELITILASSNAIQSVFFSNVPTSGSFQLSIIDKNGNTLTTPSIPFNAPAASTLLNISTTPVAASGFTLVLTRAGSPQTTTTISTPGAFPTSLAIQTAIVALTGYSGVTVSGSAGSYVINWGAIADPVTTIGTNTTGALITFVDSVQSSINNLHDVPAASYPYTDVTVTVGASGFNFNFGALSPLPSQPSSGAQAQPLMTVPSNTLMAGASVTNIQVANSVIGAPAQGTGTATCTQTGPNFVAAGSINTIGSPISGWTGVSNQLDCQTGSNVEDDTQALVRRSNELNAQANGPLLAIQEKVSLVAGVTAVLGFQNLNDAALQMYTFSPIPTSGTYHLNINGQTTTSIAYNAIASTIQTAVQALPGFSAALVTGNLSSGFTIDFNGSLGGQPVPLLTIVNNTTGVTITPAFGRPGHSIEMVVQGGDDTEIAQAILASKPAGIQTYGNVSVIVTDSAQNIYTISFSRPQQIPIYVVITLLTDTFNTPGNPGSGLNPKAKFSPGSISTIQQDVVNTGNETPIGGTVTGFGTNGLIGCFDAVPGIVNYTMFFGIAPNPTQNINIPLLPEQVAVFETFNVAVSYT